MKNTNYISVAIVLILLAFGAYVGVKVMNNSKNKQGLYKDTDKKVPDFEFVNQNEKTITNKDLKGKVYLVEFFFTACPSICPIMNQKMSKIHDEFAKNDDFAIVSISIDPTTDTPKVLKEYAKEHSVKNDNWHFLTGKPASYVFDLSNKGFKLYAGEDKSKTHGGFEHSGLFALVDKDGFIRSRYDDDGNPILYYRSLNESKEKPNQMKELVEDIKLLLNEKK